MNGYRRPLMLAALALVLTLAAAGLLRVTGLFAPPQIAHVSAGNLTDIPVMTPADDISGVVILVSDRGKADDTGLRKALLARNMIVLPVDLDTWRARLDASDGECLYLGSDLENLTKEALRTVGVEAYHHPVVVGTGEGGTLAWAALADAPAATLAGAVALDPAPVLETRLPTCPGKATITPEAGGFSYAFDAEVPGRATLVAPAPLPVASPLSPTSSRTGTDSHRAGLVVETDPARRLDIAVTAAVAIADADSRAQALPVVDIPSTGPARALAVFYSGDGGWRDLDKTMGEWLAARDIHVVGVDSLRYFWTERDPGEIAADTAAMVAEADPAGTLPVMVLGYSFGADTFPFAWPHLAPDLRSRIHMVGLLGTEQTTRFQVTVGGWLGIGGDQPVAPAIASIPRDLVVCVHGSDESETACTDPSLAGIEAIETDGGHHFDGDYPTLAARLLAAFERRLGTG